MSTSEENDKISNGSKKNITKPRGGNQLKDVTLAIEDTGSECALDIPGDVCSTEKTVHAMESHLRNKNIDTTMLKTAKDIVDTVKKDLRCNTEECILTDPQFVKAEIREIVNESLDRIKPEGPAKTKGKLSSLTSARIITCCFLFNGPNKARY